MNTLVNLSHPTKSPVFLFLQGPHGPFFSTLAKMLRRAGATTWRVGFNAGDRAFWWSRRGYIPYRGQLQDWPETCERIIAEKSVTDLVLYGDTRPIHAKATEIAHRLGLRVHVFEEGYLRPYWITYERDGSNGHSALMTKTHEEMAETLQDSSGDTRLPPGHWGDMLQHVFYGALYHGFVMFTNQTYANFTPHRSLPVTAEFRLYLRRLVLMPFQALERRLATVRIRLGSYPYHLALLQLEHDASFRHHAPFETMTDFLDLVIDGFAKGAPPHHHLVFKAHPLEDGRVPLRRHIRKTARLHGISNRVHYVRGGKLARLLDSARSAVTVNSTAGQQVLWRGLPLRCFGTAVYDKPGLVSPQPLDAFFADPTPPDGHRYDVFRRYLLQTSQVPGGFYSARGRRQAMREIVDFMLAEAGPYEITHQPTATQPQQLRVIK